MATNPAQFFTKPRQLTPGPTSVPQAVLLEMAQPIIHHRTKRFQAIFADLSQRLQRLFRTSGPVLTIAGSGTTAFEAAQVSLIRPGSKALTVAGGKFGRMVALRGSEITSVTIDEAIVSLKLVPEDDQLVLAARAVGTSFGNEE